MKGQPPDRLTTRRSPASNGVPFATILDRASAEPLSRQLYLAIRRTILSGALTPGTKLPSTRVMAAELNIGRNTATLAYDYLHAEGLVSSGVGSGTFVNRGMRIRRDSCNGNRAGIWETGTPPGSRLAQALMRDHFLAPPTIGAPRPFRLGEPAIEAFPMEAWSRLLRRNAMRARAELLAYGDPNGYRHLRRAVLEHISASRGVRAELDQVFLVRGAQQAIDLISRALLDPGDVVWVEDPGYLSTRAILDANGIRLAPVPVDADGMMIDEGARSEPVPKAVVVTPSNHFPTGATLSLDRRVQLLEHAHKHEAWVIEDDYDCEFRYNGRPLPCMQGLDPYGRVLYVGTFSKTVFPALRLGYLIVPSPLVPIFERMRGRLDGILPSVEQAALADFIVQGDYARHVRKMRELYRDRQAFLVSQADTHLTEWLRVPPVTVGMQSIAWLRSDLDEAQIVHAAAAEGVELRALSLYSMRHAMGPALVLGFAMFAEPAIRTAILQLAGTLRRLNVL